MQVFDGLVVVATFVVFITLTVLQVRVLLAYCLAYTIALRFWRLGRIYNGTISATINSNLFIYS